jgi:hypothetical protein
MPGPAMGYVSESRLFWALALLTGACASSTKPHEFAGDSSEKRPPIASEFENAPWSRIELDSLPAVVSLPDGRGWHAKRSGSFLVLEHRDSASTITLRLWSAERLVRPEACEAEARLARPALPEVEPGFRIEERRLEAPAGFDVRLVVGAQAGPEASVRGSALAVGAGVGRCYVAAYETHAGGPHAAERVADRLGLVVQGFFETVVLPNAERRVSPPVGVK